MGLESCDGLWFSSLAHHVHRLSDSHRHREGTQILVKRDQHARLDGRSQEVQHVMGVSQNNYKGEWFGKERGVVWEGTWTYC